MAETIASLLAFLVGIASGAIVLFTELHARIGFTFWYTGACFRFLLFRGLVATSATIIAGKPMESLQVGQYVLLPQVATAIAIGLAVGPLLRGEMVSTSFTGRTLHIIRARLFLGIENYLERELVFAAFHGVRAFVEQFAPRFPELDAVKQRIADNVPPQIAREEVALFIADLERARSVIEAMDLYLRFAGRTPFLRVFGPAAPVASSIRAA